MFMILSKSVDEMQHIENMTAFICGCIVLVTCAILLAIFVEKRVSAWEVRQQIIEEARLQRAQNEVSREEDNFRFIDSDLQKENAKLRKELVEKNKMLVEKDKLIDNYKQQLDEIKLGTFNGRSLKHA